MKYLTNAIKHKLHGSIGLSYVIEGAPGHNRVKKDDGTFEDQDTKLIVGEVTPQNDLITLNFQACEEGEITVDSAELRALAAELISWADISDEAL